MTAQESLAIITETLNNSRKEVTRRSGRFFILWGILLTVFSLLVYALWKTTGNAAWNNIWFAMPIIGFPLSRWFGKKDQAMHVESAVSNIVVGANMTAMIAVLFGLAETISGVALKNWAIKIAGFVTGIGGLIVYYTVATGLILRNQNK